MAAQSGEGQGEASRALRGGGPFDYGAGLVYTVAGGFVPSRIWLTFFRNYNRPKVVMFGRPTSEAPQVSLR